MTAELRDRIAGDPYARALVTDESGVVVASCQAVALRRSACGVAAERGDSK